VRCPSGLDPGFRDQSFKEIKQDCCDH
jgi:hypothetical protein